MFLCEYLLPSGEIVDRYSSDLEWLESQLARCLNQKGWILIRCCTADHPSDLPDPQTYRWYRGYHIYPDAQRLNRSANA